jgi:hypothetical protein
MLEIFILLVILIVVGALLFYAVDLLPIQPPFKNLLKVVLILFGVLILVTRFYPQLR